LARNRDTTPPHVTTIRSLESTATSHAQLRESVAIPSPEKEGSRSPAAAVAALGTAARRIAAPRRGSAMPANDLTQGSDTTDRLEQPVTMK